MKITQNYLKLPLELYQENLPKPVKDPQFFLFNQEIANNFVLPTEINAQNKDSALVLSGNMTDISEKIISCGYAGHQFANFVPQLGDGRAHLLGQIRDTKKQVFDLQLKGSGTSRYSRGGDGRCTLKAAIREYLMSSIMDQMNVSTTKILSIVTADEHIKREELEQMAILARVARSHIRIGTFQYAALHEDPNILRALADFVINELYPECEKAENPYLNLFESIMEKTLHLVINWLRVGFIHGVLNTDNIAISGETLDYGPCSFMNEYNPKQVFSSIDIHGRYRYEQQAHIMHWNLARLAECLIPLVHQDENIAIEMLSNKLNQFGSRYHTLNNEMRVNKLGFKTVNQETLSLSQRFMDIMAQNKINYHQAYANLSTKTSLMNSFKEWQKDWENTKKSGQFSESRLLANNPQYPILNHDIEKVITDVARGNKGSMSEYLRYLNSGNHASYGQIDKSNTQGYRTYCGT